MTRPFRIVELLARPFDPLMSGIVRFYRAGARASARKKFRSIGANLDFDPTRSTISYPTVSVGDNVHLGWGAYLIGDITIGDDVMFGPEVHVQDGYHRFDVVGQTIRESGAAERRRVVIGNDVWIGAQLSVLKGVTVGDGSVVGTGSIVLKDIPPYVIAVGTPCKPIRKRYDDDELREHLILRGASAEEAQRVVAERNAALEHVFEQEHA